MDARLRRWRPDDRDALVRATSDVDVARQVGGSLDENAAHAWIEPRTTEERAEKHESFAIVVDGLAVGDVTVAIEPRHRNGWLSYWLEPESRGHGFAARAVATISEWAFEHHNLFRLELGHRTNNPGRNEGQRAVRYGGMEPVPAESFSPLEGRVTSPATDDLDVRRAQQARLRELVREQEAEHGPVDPALLAELRGAAETWPQ